MTTLCKHDLDSEHLGTLINDGERTIHIYSLHKMFDYGPRHKRTDTAILVYKNPP